MACEREEASAAGWQNARCPPERIFRLYRDDASERLRKCGDPNDAALPKGQTGLGFMKPFAIGSGGSPIDTDQGAHYFIPCFSINVECASMPIGPELLIF